MNYGKCCVYQKSGRKAALRTFAALAVVASSGIGNHAHADRFPTPPVSDTPPPSPNSPNAAIDKNPQASLPPIGSVTGWSASPAFTTTINGVEYVGDQLLVYFKPDIDEQTRLAVFAQYGLTVLVHAPINGMYQCRIQQFADVQMVRRQLRALPVIQDVGLNAIGHADNTPTDFYYSRFFQPGTSNVYANYQPGTIAVQWPLYKMNMATAWDRSLGNTNYVIAVLDTGIQTNHPDLNPKILRNSSGSVIGDGVYSSVFEDTQGHGSLVAGLAAANNSLSMVGNSDGIAGVCPQSPIYPIRVTDSAGHDTEADFVTAINKAVLVPGVKVINISYGFSPQNPNAPDTLSARTQLNQAILQATNRGILVVASMGNDYTEYLQFPAALWNVMAVSATDGSDNKANYSSTGYYNSVAAPGGYESEGNGWILSTFNNGTYYYLYGYGTSYAAPEVAGLAAVTLALYPSMMPWDLKARLEDTATDTNATAGSTVGGTYPALPGFDNYLGWGMVNGDKATQSQTTQTFSFPATGSAYRAVSIPVWPTYTVMDPSNRSTDIANVFPGATSVLWFDPSAGLYRDYSDARVPRIGAGQAYWVRFSNACVKNYTGALAYQYYNGSHPATVHLQRGWNLVGNPYTGNITWSLNNVQVRAFDNNPSSSTYNQQVQMTLASAVANNWTYTYMYHIKADGSYEKLTDPSDTSSSLHQMVPGEAYFIYAVDNLDFLLPKG